MTSRTLFLDTQALVRIATEPSRAMATRRFIVSREYTLVTCSMLYAELYPHVRRWDEVADFIASVPFCIAENIELLTEREASRYPAPVRLRMGFCSDDTVFTKPELKAAILINMHGKVSGFDVQRGARQVFDALVRDRDSFGAPEQNGRYSPEQREMALLMSVFPALPPQCYPALQARVSGGEVIDIKCFKSVYMQQLAIWLEYYEQGKAGKQSDVGDFLMLAYVPYVDEAVLDKERVDVVRRINRTGVLGRQMQVRTLSEFLAVVGSE